MSRYESESEYMHDVPEGIEQTWKQEPFHLLLIARGVGR